MKSREEKLIALKVLLSVQDLSELSRQSKDFKADGVVVKNSDQTNANEKVHIKTPFVKEVSWLLFQFKYVFQDSLADFLRLCDGLSNEINKLKKPQAIAEYLIVKSGKLLS